MATTRSSGYVVTHSVWNAVLSRLTDDGVTFSGNFSGGSIAATTGAFTGAVTLRGSTGDGTWSNEAFDAADYTANNLTSWTVASGDVIINRYTRISDTVVWDVRVATTTVSTSAATELRIALPGGFTGSSSNGPSVRAAYCVDNAVLSEAIVSVGTAYVSISLLPLGTTWAASTDATTIFFQIVFELA